MDDILLQQKVIDDILKQRKNKGNYVNDLKSIVEKYFNNLITIYRLFILQKVNLTFKDFLKLNEKEIDIILKNINENPYKGLF